MSKIKTQYKYKQKKGSNKTSPLSTTKQFIINEYNLQSIQPSYQSYQVTYQGKCHYQSS